MYGRQIEVCFFQLIRDAPSPAVQRRVLSLVNSGFFEAQLEAEEQENEETVIIGGSQLVPPVNYVPMVPQLKVEEEEESMVNAGEANNEAGTDEEMNGNEGMLLADEVVDDPFPTQLGEEESSNPGPPTSIQKLQRRVHFSLQLAEAVYYPLEEESDSEDELATTAVDASLAELAKPLSLRCKYKDCKAKMQNDRFVALSHANK